MNLHQVTEVQVPNPNITSCIINKTSYKNRKKGRAMHQRVEIGTENHMTDPQII